MAVAKTPFFVIQEFLSPKLCEEVVDHLNFFSVDHDPEGKPLVMKRHHERSEQIIFERFAPLVSQFEEYYGFKHRGTEQMTFEYYSEGTKGEPQSENSNYIRKKWVRTKDRDFSCMLFLSSYQDKVPFDNHFEVYGGKFEFAQHQFGFNSERGTLIVFPSGPHFINAIAPIIAGDLFVARFHMAAAMPYLYNPKEFPGSYQTWFKGLF